MKYPITAAAVLVASSPALAQFNPFGPVQQGDLTVGIVDFAELPDSGSPARASVMTSDPAGRLFVNDQRGPLYTVSDDGSSVTEYLDLRDVGGVSLRTASGEQGFQSFAFHPDFYNVGTSGYGKFYTFASSSVAANPDFNGSSAVNFSERLLEWTASDPTASTFTPANAAAPYREVIRFAENYGNHNGGLIAFNTTGDPADRGNLYLALGDGGSGNDPDNNGQDASNPYGAVLRINPLGKDSANGQYGLVQANAFASDDDANTLAEIYSYGLRNPQRFGWDTADGSMYIADIGQDRIEELDLAVNGGNFGWDRQEGSFDSANPGSGDDSSFIDPVAEYDHNGSFPGNTTGSYAMTVGEVARGTGIDGLDGKLLAGDFPNGILLYLDVDNDPLDGGQDGLFELGLVDDDGNDVRLIDLINEERAVNGLGSVTRADLRYSLGTGGQVFVTNKQDGVIRQLVAIPEPASIGLLGLGGLYLLRRRNRA